MRLLENLQEYDFDIQYLPGAKNYMQDALSRWPDYKDPPIPKLKSNTRSSAAESEQTAQLLSVYAAKADEWLNEV